MIGRLDERLRLAAIGALVYFMASLQMVIRGMDSLWAKLPASVRQTIGPVAQRLQAADPPDKDTDTSAKAGSKRAKSSATSTPTPTSTYELAPTNVGRGVVAGIIFVSLYVSQKGAPGKRVRTDETA